MPAMDFPSSPTNGQVFGAYTYDSTKGAWRVTGVQATSVISSPTPPTNPTAGNIWLNTNDGVLFVYYNDGDTSQWIEMKANTASGSTVAARVDALEAKPNALVDLLPVSVTVGSGTSSTSANGVITFSGASSISLNNIFSSTYRNYSVLLNVTGSSVVGNPVYIRLRAANSDNAAASYQWITSNVYFNGIRQIGNSGITWAEVGYTGSGDYSCFSKLDIANPFVSEKTYSTMARTYNNENTTGGWWHNDTGSYTGFTLIAGSGNISGTVQVYGYR